MKNTSLPDEKKINYIICVFKDREDKEDQGVVESIRDDIKEMKQIMAFNFERIEAKQKNLELHQSFLTQKMDALTLEFNESKKKECKESELPSI